MQKRKNRKRNYYFAISQISSLILLLFSFSFFISNIDVVHGLAPLPRGTDSTLPQSELPPSDPPSNPPENTGDSGLGSITGLIGSLFKGDAFGGGLTGGLISSVVWAGTVYGLVRFLAPAFGASEQLTDALSKAALAGVFAGRASYFLFGGIEKGAATKKILGMQAGQGAFVIGLGVAIAVFLLTYKKERTEIVQYQCLPYEPPLGGDHCERCNDDPFRPCSEYRCRSLGQACALVNPGTTEEKCVWVNPGDVTSPTITPWDEPLTEGHRYVNHDTRPPSLGTTIVRDDAADGCLAPFTPLAFGFTTNEPAQCKIDFVHTNSSDAMRFFVGDTNFFIEEHEHQLSLPSPESINAEFPELQNDGEYDLFVRCVDANGNENVDEFVFNFCIDPSPDTTPPVIVDTSIIPGSPVAFDVGNVTMDVFINEPAECRWSVQDKNYEDMENNMACSTSVVEQNAQQLYPCTTTLTGIKNNELNTYYFRCKDKPSFPEEERNVNTQSYEFALRGTEPLNIIDVGPNGTITDSTDVVDVELTVETSNGADEGVATCYFSDTGDEGSYIAMFNTNSFTHNQLLTLGGGNYTYHFRCVDAGGNADETNTTFEVFVDTQAPEITRAYRDLDALKIVTNEDASCVYSLNSCNYNFDEGISMIYSNPSIRNNHFSPWEPNLVYYIKCQDDFGNEPFPNECSIIASATNIV